jgi:hypothetical protein
LAWVIAVFLELAIFSDTISDKIRRDHIAVNQPVYSKIEQYEAQLAAEIEKQRSNLASLEELRRSDLTIDRNIPQVIQSSENERLMRYLEDEIKTLVAQEQELRRELRSVEEQIATFAQEMNAEQLGQRVNAGSTGRAGTGPRYQFARQQKELYESRRSVLQNELSQWRAKRDELSAQRRRLAEETAAERERNRATIKTSRDTLAAQVEAARAELTELEGSRLARIEAFRLNAFAALDYQKQRDDPLARMTAYQELKNDPKDGRTITLFSWMTKFFVIFLEIMPVVAKMFFSPPSVYAAKIQGEVERERQRAKLASSAESLNVETAAVVAPAAVPKLQPAADLDWLIARESNSKPVADAVPGSTPAALESGNRENEFVLIPLHEFEQQGDRSRHEFEPATRVSEMKKEPSPLRPRRR